MGSTLEEFHLSPARSLILGGLTGGLRNSYRRLNFEDGKQIENTYRFTVLEARKWYSAASVGMVDEDAR